MKCYFCDSRFFGASMSSPAESCDCGENVTPRDVRAMDEAEFGEAQARSQEALVILNEVA